MKVFVGAANYQHFLDWCEFNNQDPRVDEVYFLHREEQLWGQEPNKTKCIFYPTFWERENASEIVHYAQRLEGLRNAA